MAVEAEVVVEVSNRMDKICRTYVIMASYTWLHQQAGMDRAAAEVAEVRKQSQNLLSELVLVIVGYPNLT